MLLIRRQVLCQQQDHGGEETLSSIVKKLVLSIIPLAILVHDGLGQDLGVFLRLGPGGQIFRFRPAHVHVVVDESQQVVPV